ncbi:MAG: DUF533 domain-containing protein, partial [Fuerstiella sp.]
YWHRETARLWPTRATIFLHERSNARGDEMNPMDILGGLLKNKMGAGSSSGGGGGGLGGSILESILKGQGRGGAQSPASRKGTGIPSVPAGSPRIVEPRRGQEDEFNSLEDFLRHAHKGSDQRQRSAPAPAPAPQRNPFPSAEPQIARRQTEFTAEYEGNPEPFNRQAEVLVIAMINAAKADGQIDQKEQDAIVKQLGDLSQDEVQFLRSEFAKPLNVKEFVWSVPIGMERQVYGVSLMAINLDQNSEAQYLRELGHGFRLSLEECNRLHQEFGAPILRA